MSQSAVKRLQSDYLELLREPIEYIIAKPSEEDILLWHYVLFGPPDCPYAGGEYHGTIVFPFEYPFKPPGIQMLTPNGRFNPTMKICLTMSDYHPETWNPSWTVTTLLLGLLSFMVDPTEPTGVGCIRESGERRLQLAKESRQFNLSDPSFCALFPELSETRELLPKQHIDSDLSCFDDSEVDDTYFDSFMESDVEE